MANITSFCTGMVTGSIIILTISLLVSPTWRSSPLDYSTNPPTTIPTGLATSLPPLEGETPHLYAMRTRLAQLELRMNAAELLLKYELKVRSGWLTSNSQRDLQAFPEHLVATLAMQVSKDVIGRRDFALYSGGARIKPEWTSPLPTGWKSKGKLALSSTPELALHPDINVGNCWQFTIPGQLAIILSRTILISEITVDHIAKELAYDISMAPKLITVWGLLGSEDAEKKYLQYQQTFHDAGSRNDAEDEDRFAPPYPPSNKYLHIASFTYDLNSRSHIQTFAIPPQIVALQIPFQVIVAQVHSNWGYPDQACLYRLRVHGTVPH